MPSIPYRISAWNRHRKYAKFQKFIKPIKTDRVLDVGFTEIEYSSTDNYLERHYPWQENLTALGVDEPVDFPNRYPKVKTVQYDGGIFPFSDKQFDICWSNAVLEHAGDFERQLIFIKETKRVAKKVFLTTPNKFFPIEVHTRVPLLHLLPKKYFDHFLRLIGKDWATGDYMHLLSIRDIKKLLKAADIANYQILRNRLLFFTLDFVIIWSDENS
jgi:SAM-dependent methyltransferase